MAKTYNGRFDVPEEPKVNSAFLVVGLALIPLWPSFFPIIASVVCFVKFRKQVNERNLLRRFHECCALIGMRERVPLKQLKGPVGAGNTMAEVRRNIPKMVARGYFGRGAYVDIKRDELVLAVPGRETEQAHGHGRSWRDVVFEVLEALRGKDAFQGEAQEDFDARKPEPERAEEPKPEPKPQRAREPIKQTYAEKLEDALNTLYQLNQQIVDEGVSQRIDRIGTLTAGIFRVVIEKPEREQEVRKFMNYYLPTTIKLLRNYDMMENQSYQSESIVESRKKIEEVLDVLISAYEKQLDRLFRNDALDIATDIDVLETMMEGDGLSSKGKLPL